MYPPQTSLIPTAVALTKFFEIHGFSSFNMNYPFWYLGSTPYKFLIGPVIPILLSFFHKVFINQDLFSIIIYLIAASLLFSAIGWILLVLIINQDQLKQDQNRKIFSLIQYLLLFILFLILPWKYLSGLALDEASFAIARNFLPWVLICFWQTLKEKKLSIIIITIISTSLLFLINTTILPILIVGVLSLVLAYSFDNGKIRRITKNLKYPLLIIITSLFVITFWYSPNYWLTILTNPSIGGASGIKVIIRIFDLLKGLVPVILAIAAVYISKKIESRLMVFSLVWIFTFLFLTTFRFLGDPDFWQDWTAWAVELEVGIWLLFYKLILENKQLKSVIGSKLLLIILLLFVPLLITYYAWNKLGKPELISSNLPPIISGLDKLETLAGNNLVFLSGSTVFWSDALFDIKQVRGGRDEVALDADWDKASWEIREGQDPQKTLNWINKLNISYILIHKQNSYEYYHDFKNLNKWEKIGEKVWENNQDVIINVIHK